MTCIVAFRNKEKNIILAGDKMGSDSFTSMISKVPKVFTNDDFAIGYTSSFRMGQLLQHVWLPPQRKVDQSTDNYLYSDVTASLRKMFKENGFGDDDTNEFGNFIMIYEDRILEMQDEMSFLEHETDIVSVGAGCYHATAAMQLLLDYESDNETILTKLFDLVGYNIVSVSTQYDWMEIKMPTYDEEDNEEKPKRGRPKKET